MTQKHRWIARMIAESAELDMPRPWERGARHRRIAVPQAALRA